MFANSYFDEVLGLSFAGRGPMITKRFVDAVAFVGFWLLGIFLFLAVMRLDPGQSVLGLFLGSALLVGSGMVGYKLPGWIRTRSLSKQAETLFAQGSSWLEEDPAKAATYFSDAADITGSATPRLWHAVAVEEQGFFDEAADLYGAAWLAAGMRQNALRGTIASCLAHVSMRRDDFVLAEEWATKSIEKLPDSDYEALSYVYIDRGLARWRQGREAEADRDFEWVLTHPTSANNQRIARLFIAVSSLTDAARQGLESFLDQASAFRLPNQSN